ncbi:hypothetical protein IWW48_000115 [Coemansia sp. RSA 1200]|nr:hypothetical protein IWW48_000115 [Coemansia sp. RSA 1200]
MNDSVTFLIALGLVFLVLRWLLSQGGAEQGQEAGVRQSRRMHVVRTEHVQTIQAMFPDIPEAAIRADLARTGSPAVTSDNILRNGGALPMPPTTRAEQNASTAAAAAAIAAAAAANSGHANNAAANNGRRGSGMAGSATSSGIALNASHSPLVSRLRISKDTEASELPLPPPKVWETDPSKRADVLRKRKEFMLMEARKKYLDKQNTPPPGTSEASSSVSTKISTVADDEAVEPERVIASSSSPSSSAAAAVAEAVPAASNAS